MRKIVFIFLAFIAFFWGMCFYGGQEKGSWEPWPENFFDGCVKAWNYIGAWATGTSNESISSKIEEIYKITNDERVKEDLPLLERDERLELLAQGHAEYMYKNGEDCNHDGFYERADSVFTMGYNSVAENVARDSRASGESFVKQWMDSLEHSINILNGRMKKIGVGVYGGYAVQLFAGY